MSPYLRLIRFDKPVGTWLLLFPVWWSITITTPAGLPSFYTLFLFALGAFFMRSAGCVINDILDKDIDAQVERTKSRPLASGKVTTNEALLILAFLLFMALFVLLEFNKLTIILGFVIVIPIALYPLAKRFFPWPQLILGLVFNWGVIMAEAAVTEHVTHQSILLYIACVLWTLGYDTIYGHQDKSHDELIGIQSSSLTFGSKTKPVLVFVYGLMMILLSYIGFLNEYSIIFYAGMFLAAGHLTRQIVTLNIDDPINCMYKFKSNVFLGWIIFLTLMFEKSVQLHLFSSS